MNIWRRIYILICTNIYIYSSCVILLLSFDNADGYTPSLGTVLLYTTAQDIRITNTSRPGKVAAIVRNLEDAHALDFYSQGKLICWSDHKKGSIQCAGYNGTQTGTKFNVVSSGLNTPNGLCIDWYTEKVYWTDGETNRIEVASLNGTHRKVLFWSDIDQPRAIAVMPMKGLMFWTDWGEVPKIERAAMNGDPATRKVIVNEKIFWPNGLTLDYEAKKIYWLDAKLKFIDVMDLDGKNRKTIVKDGLTYAFALTTFNNRLYWTDWETWSILMWDMGAKGPIKDLIKPGQVPVDIRVWDSNRQPAPTSLQPCQQNNANCSHLCLLSSEPQGYTCACPTGVKLLDKERCADGPQAQLILVQRRAICRVSLDLPDYTTFPIPLHGIKSAIAVDYDAARNFIYWTDDARMISRSHLDGTNQSTVVQREAGNPDGIAVDSTAGNLYWTDPIADTITTSRLDGSSPKVLINEDLSEPRAIAVAPSLGWMFWSDWYVKKPKIERASLDGTDRILLVSDRLGWPNGIALDIKAMNIYWGDAYTHKIEFCKMDGSDRRELIGDNLPHIFGLTLLGDYLYWTDWQRRSLDRVHKLTGADREVIVEQLPDVMGLKAFNSDDGAAINECFYNNGNCSHLCFKRPTDFVCGCPIGLELSNDNRTCVIPSAFLLYARKDKIGRLSIENRNSDAFLPIKDIKDACALAVHVSDGRIYWADCKTRNIGRCAVNGSNPEKVIEWTNVVEGLAIDWAGNNLYWSDSAAQRIEVARMDGSHRRALIWQGLRKPKSIALDPTKGYMYWSEWGSKSIKRAWMDGSLPTLLMDQIGRANALTIDSVKGNLIWVTLEPAGIEMSDLDGLNRKKLIVENVVMPFALTLYRDYIYWADWNTGDIESALKSTGGNRSHIKSNLEYISDMVVYHQSLQLGTNPCSVNNGGCSHFCLAVPAFHGKLAFKCGCPTHYHLNKDNSSCSAPVEFIMFSQRNGMGRVMTGGNDCPDASLPLAGLKMVRALDYDPLHRRVYWIDGRTETIRHMSETGGGTPVVLVSGLIYPIDMALDAIGRTIFWSCAKTNTINVTRLDNDSSIGVVVQGAGMMPRYIALHQNKRLIFWSDVGTGAVHSAGMDGAGRVEIAKAPNITALAVDPYTDTVYWANAKQIYASSLNGDGRRIIWQGGIVQSLAVLSGTLYWIDGEKQLMHLPLNKKDAPAHPVMHVLHITDVVAVYKLDQKNMCFGGGGCGGVCLAHGSCGCTRGLSQASQNGDATRCGPPPPCDGNSFTCQPSKYPHYGKQVKDCIPIGWRCDGQKDCSDGSDEADCARCEGKFKCGDGECLETELVCDGAEQCADGADEANCCSGPRNYQCPGTRVCIPARSLCDGWEHCADGADEAEAFCAQRRTTRPPERFTTLYIIGMPTILALLALLAGVFMYCRRRMLSLERLSPDDRADDPLSPKTSTRGRKPPGFRPEADRSRKPSDAVRMSALTGKSSSGMERNPGTGASSSATNGSSLAGRYPREPLNPPPSPATTAPSASVVSRHRPYRHYRAINQPPPPTPCSTDVCDESDCTLSYPALPMSAGAFLEAPPPTPCPPSPPFPPSPSSRSSACFSPLPPPPSPVPHPYDS